MKQFKNITYSTLFACLLSLSAFAKEGLPAVWSRIDKINAELKIIKKPVSIEDFQRLLSEAVAISNDEELENHYQDVRAKSFEKENFKEAQVLAKRAAPGFLFEFGGDNDLHDINYEFFLSLTKPGSPERRFLETYTRYKPHLNFDTGISLETCMFPFYYAHPVPEANIAKDRLKKKAVTKDLEKLSAELPTGYLKSKTSDFMNCLNPNIPKAVEATKKDIYKKEKIVQLILDYEPLQKYLHPEMPKRSPLVLSDALIGSEFDLKKFDKKVLIQEDAKVEGNFLRFTTFECKLENYCNIVLEYPAEKIRLVTGAWTGPLYRPQLEKTSIITLP
jgi:hypothetical protein